MRFSRPLLVALCMLSLPALAADKIVKVPLAEVLAMPEAKEKLSGTVTFHLKGTKAPDGTVVAEQVVTNKKTNAFNKSPADACRWVTLSALIQLDRDAQKRGATAVVDLVSWFRKRETTSPKTIDCHVGGVMAGVALKGRAVRK